MSANECTWNGKTYFRDENGWHVRGGSAHHNSVKSRGNGLAASQARLMARKQRLLREIAEVKRTSLEAEERQHFEAVGYFERQAAKRNARFLL